ncbi:hypothetical protein [Halorubrum sp. FL23]|uniref:hypothetical protein n=1 Tax=Halorubrum sp. FL23 TaxID=3458704 RepID=UPI0040337FA4
MKRRHLLSLAGATGASSLTVGSGAFTSSTTQRGVNINVVPDGQAPVGYAIQSDQETADGTPVITVPVAERQTIPLVKIQNRLTGAAQITGVEIEPAARGEPELVDIEWDTDPFPAGEGTTIRGTVACTETGHTTVGLSVSVDAPTLNAEVSGTTTIRQFQLRCVPPASLPNLTPAFTIQNGEEDGDGGDSSVSSESTRVVFNGLGTVSLRHPRDGFVDVKFYVGNKTGANKQMFVNPRSVEKVKTNEKVGGDRFSSESVVGIRIADSDSIYLHPSWNQDRCAFDKGSGGTVMDPVSTEDTGFSECTSE